MAEATLVGFKEDASFARNVSMGAIATDIVRTDLARYGHACIELERGALANKIWQVKVKRLRLPDLVCTRCGVRTESRGKSALTITASHSAVEGRTWDSGGMRPGDLYAFLRVDITTSPPYTGPPVYFHTSALRDCVALAKKSTRKAASEGSEVTLLWKSWTPTYSGTFDGVDDEGRLVCCQKDGRLQRYRHWRDWGARHVYLTPGDPVVAHDTMVAGVVAPTADLTCPADWNLATALAAADPAERYAAVKAAGRLHRTELYDDLVRLADNDNDWRLRVEATASLARLDPEPWVTALAKTAATRTGSNEQRLESVFALSELPTNTAAEALAEIAAPDADIPTELRAAAVWGIACGTHPRPDLVVDYTVDDDDLVALHALAGLTYLPEDIIPRLLDWLDHDDRHAAAASHLLLHHQAVRPLLTAVRAGNTGRLWALRALGDLPPELVHQHGRDLLTPEIAKELQPLWIAHNDWLRGSGADGLHALKAQTIRFSP